MAKIKVEVDTDESQRGGKAMSGTKIGFLSSITPDPILQTAYTVGTGLSKSDLEFAAGQGFKYNKSDLDNKGNGLKSNCGVIATVGGGVTIDAVTKSGVRFVCLVGTPPAANSTIVGGVCLDSIKLNTSRKNYLKGLSSGANQYTDANIFLYMNSNSQMTSQESAAWNNANTGKNSAAGQNGGVNDPTAFAGDFAQNGPLDTAKALIISDDPFFRAARGELIKQANAWLARDASRKIVYPSQMYGSPVLNDLAGNPQAPTAGKSILYGPDLIEAYHLLGMLARCSLDNETATIGFISATPHIVPL